jgi:hypothetical protein
MSDQHAPPGPSYTLREAARILGVSVTALRRRVASGQISAERVQRPQGSVWRVFLDPHAPGDDRSVRVAERHRSDPPAERGSERGSNDEVDLPHRSRPEPGTVELIALVGELSQKLAESAAVAAMWQERARVLGERLALEAPESPFTAPTGPESSATAPWPVPGLLAPLDVRHRGRAGDRPSGRAAGVAGLNGRLPGGAESGRPLAPLKRCWNRGHVDDS